MEILDRVYNAFSNLDRDFAKSKKSRSEFIQGKFGGDINMGSMLILDAISSSSDVESPEDIKKLTFVKDIFAKLQDAQDRLDTLPDFQFTNGSLYQDLLQLLQDSKASGTHIRHVSQKEINRLNRRGYHFIATPEGLLEVPRSQCKVFHAYNENIIGELMQTMLRSSLQVDKFYEQKSATHLVEVTEDRARKLLK